MKRCLMLFILPFAMVYCSGYETEHLQELNSEQGLEEPIDDRAPDSEEPAAPIPPVDNSDDAGPGPEPFKCVKSLHHDPLFNAQDFILKACKKASRSQLAEVNKGRVKKEKFLEKCYEQTGNSCWCDQLTRPNPSSRNTFRCTYGNNRPHVLIHPNESSWKHAIEAAKIVLELEKKGIGIKIIYNWWRPEPYNKNVGGAAGRHPHGTSVDVRFVSKADQNRAHSELCKMRKRGRIRAIGYYRSTALHFGVGDRNGNTWGKSCP